MKPRRLSFEVAKARYPNRFTGEHVPSWARKPAPDGRFYAPQYRTDREWYEHTVFPGEPEHILGRLHGGACDSRMQSWPMGQWLDAPFVGARK